jgi:2-phosphosulfolactate phosphatase
MTHCDQAQFDIRCEWGPAAIDNLAAAGVIIIVDVLSFTTSVDIAAGQGAIVFPCRWNDHTARAYAAERNAELAGGREQQTGRYSLAPSSLLDLPAGLRLVLPSPNGSEIAHRAAAGGATVLAGSLRNAARIATRAQAFGKRISVVPAGERWPDGSLRPAIEDLIGAGAIIAHLSGSRSPEADGAVAAFDSASRRLADSILTCSSGRELVERGFQGDVELAVELNVSQTVPVLQNGAFTDVAR